MTPRLMKEIRALLPVWLACAIAVGTSAIASSSAFLGVRSLGLLGYGFGSIVLGAQSVGHEYTHRMLGNLLSQPSDRRRLFLMKLGVLAVMLALLNGLVWGLWSNLIEFHGGVAPRLMLMVTLSALFVAPWLTMLCRGPLAGAVFTMALPGTLWTATSILMIATNGLGSRTSADSLRLAVWMMFAICGVGTVASWRMFMCLEAIEGRGPEMHLPQWLQRRAAPASDARGTLPVRAQSPAWLLVKKEVHLQGITFVVAAIYILCWTTAALLERFAPDFPVDFPLLPLTILYFGLLSILIGSLASAEERHLGTLEWQVLLPMPMWRQWMLKVAVAIGLALVLGVVLPIALSYVHVSEDMRVQGAPLWHDKAFLVRMTTAVVLLTSCGLYLSSLSTGGIRALVLSIPAVFAGAAFLPHATDWAERMAYRSIYGPGGHRLPAGPFYSRLPSPLIRFAADYLSLAMAAGLVALLLGFALQNHRSAERNLTRVLRQGTSIVGFLALAALLLAGLQAFFRTRFY